MLLSVACAILAGYLIGSIPAAYAIVKYAAQRDIRYEGSGNAGALNSYEVTRKKWVGVAVLCADVLKGVCAVAAASLFEPGGYAVQASAGVAAVLGHNFNVWLRFHGGRGLATALGVMLVLGWVYAVCWMVLWALAFLPGRNIHVGNVAASVCAPAALLFLPDSLIGLSSQSGGTASSVALTGAALSVLILARHAHYIQSWFRHTSSVH